MEILCGFKGQLCTVQTYGHVRWEDIEFKVNSLKKAQDLHFNLIAWNARAENTDVPQVECYVIKFFQFSATDG